MKKYLCLLLFLFLAGCGANGKRYVFLFIGDGMGQAAGQAASVILTGERDNLTFHNFPEKAFAATWSIDTYNFNARHFGLKEYAFYNADYSVGYPYKELGTPPAWQNNTARDSLLLEQLPTDSAASATAYATGAKARNGTVSFDGASGPIFNVLDRIKNRSPLRPIFTAIITTDKFYGATPAAFAAHNVSRHNAREIYEEILNVSKPDVVAGANEYNDIEKFGYKTTGLNLPYEKGAKIYSPVESLTAVMENFIKYAVSANKSVFAVIEQSGIDAAGHANDFKLAIDSIEDLNNAVSILCEFIDSGKSPMNWNNTLVIITADHETGGLRINKELQKGVFPAQTNAYGKNIYPGGEIKFLTDIHTADLVRFFAKGGGIGKIMRSVHDKYPNTGIIDNTDVFQYIRKFLNL